MRVGESTYDCVGVSINGPLGYVAFLNDQSARRRQREVDGARVGPISSLAGHPRYLISRDGERSRLTNGSAAVKHTSLTRPGEG